MLEQNKFKQCLLSFDDNKILKDQLDMLIFIQVCMTIDKNLIYQAVVLEEQFRANKFLREVKLRVRAREFRV